MPTTVASVIGTGGGADYSTIAAWEADTDNDLVTADEYHEGQLQGQDFSNVSAGIAGATEDATRYRRLTVVPGAECRGRTVESSGAGHARVIGDPSGITFHVTDQHTDIDSFEVAEAGGQTLGTNGIRFSLQSSGAEHHVHDLVVHNKYAVNKGSSSYGLAPVDADAVMHMYRNIVFGFDYSGIACIGAAGSTCHHNTVFKCNRSSTSGRGGIDCNLGSGANFTVKNNLCLNNNLADYASLTSAGTHAKNASSDTSGDTGYQNRVIATDTQYSTDTDSSPADEQGEASEIASSYFYAVNDPINLILSGADSTYPITWFDLSAIPTTAMIISASLSVQADGSGEGLQPNHMNSQESSKNDPEELWNQAKDNTGTYNITASVFTANNVLASLPLNKVGLARLTTAVATSDVFGVSLYNTTGSAPLSIEIIRMTISVVYWAGEDYGGLKIREFSTLRNAGDVLGAPYNVGIQGNLVGELPDIGADEYYVSDARQFRGGGPRPHEYRASYYRASRYRPHVS